MRENLRYQNLYRGTKLPTCMRAIDFREIHVQIAEHVCACSLAVQYTSVACMQYVHVHA